MKRLLVVFSLLFAISCASDYTCYVDPFIGTGGFGHTFPGACAPFGMVQPSPVTGYGSQHISHDEVMQGGELRFVMKK